MYQRLIYNKVASLSVTLWKKIPMLVFPFIFEKKIQEQLFLEHLQTAVPNLTTPLHISIR